MIGRFFRWVAQVVSQVGAVVNGGRSGDESAATLYEKRDEYRP